MDSLFPQLQNAIAGRFSLDRELGRGGMGVVYLARDVALDRLVAIKVLPPDLAAQADHRERFLREARTAAGLSHPHIVPIHLVEENAALVFFVMGFVDGETLGDRVRRQGPLAADEATRIIREVAWALGYAHGRGVVHRDIKPDNILLERGSGRAMVTDFGIARVASRATMSQQGEIIGTLQYMSPEQADAGATVDGRSDLYSLGATAFFALTGRTPFDAPTAVALLAMHLTEPAPPLAAVRTGIPPRLAEAVDRCLAKDPLARFASADQLAATLGELPVSRAIPPSILALREASSIVGWMLYMPTMAWFATRMLAPESAPAVGWIAVAFAALGLAQFVGMVRAVVRAGHTTADVADVAMQVMTAALEDRNASVSLAQSQKLNRMIRGPIGRVVLALVGIGYWAGGIGLLRKLLTRGTFTFSDAFAVVTLAGFGTLLLGVALQKGWFRLGPDVTTLFNRRTNIIKRWAGRFWDNPVMRAIFRIAGLGAAPPKGEPVQKNPTEVLLGKAADDLFAALPRDVRGRLKDVPDVIRDLERAAQALRARRDTIQQAIGEAGQMAGTRRDDIVRELEAAREAAAARLAMAVTALENLRLDLLRLRAGVGSAGDLTTSLEAARRVGDLVSAELEIRELLGPGA